MIEKNPCPFCALQPNQKLLCENQFCRVIFDGFPVSPGHVLIVPKKHVASYFELSDEEQNRLWEMVNHCKQQLDALYHPDGYNVGINVNGAAGQTVPHVHIHLIPRYTGDVPEPRGGVRGVIPSKQKY